jgi:hypothetical protein
MRYKKARFGARIAAANAAERYRDVHVFIGGTGAVGGTALLKMLSIYEEMMAVHPPGPDDVPVLVATGKSSLEIRLFLERLFRYQDARYGKDAKPAKIRDGYLTHSGVFVVLDHFELRTLDRLPALEELEEEAAREAVARYFIEIGTAIDAPADQIVEALSSEISKLRPISSYLARYRDSRLAKRSDFQRYRCVFNGIPLPSFLSYPRDLDAAASFVPTIHESMEKLKAMLVRAIRDDLEIVKRDLAESVIVAHTTSVGGMYDETFDKDGVPRRSIRLGFSHSAKDEVLIDKQRFAEKLTKEYGDIGVKVLITAAAIGIDEVRIRRTVPLHSGLKKMLRQAKKDGAELYAESVTNPFVAVVRPLLVPISEPPSEPVHFKRTRELDDLRPTYSLRSGENGIFSVSNADALYRVMRVASTGELGLVLAMVGLLGDDPQSPWFDQDNVCYYTEGDNSRQVFEFLSQPMLHEAQISGLDPLALQDLGSAKHQGELHTLALLILLHRLETLDVSAIPPYVDLDRFDARDFFDRYSRPLTLDDVDAWDVETVARKLTTLVTADEPEQLAALAPFRLHGHDALFQAKVDARTKILELVKRAVWAIPSLGSPIVFERDGKALMRCGYFIAPLETLLTRTDSFDTWLREHHRASRNACSFEEYRDFHLCNFGFIDIRPHAIVCTAQNDRSDLRGRVRYARTEGELRDVLGTLDLYSYFTTCGLLAVLFRLKALYSSFKEGDVKLGTLQEAQWQMPRDAQGHLLLVPGVAEAMRMVSEGLEKTTGSERLDGSWGYERRPPPNRAHQLIDGLHK